MQWSGASQRCSGRSSRSGRSNAAGLYRYAGDGGRGERERKKERERRRRKREGERTFISLIILNM